jgi:hypothetical protein
LWQGWARYGQRKNSYLLLDGAADAIFPSDIKEGTWTDGAKENIWTEERLSDRRLEETA